jgi:hypothetical protein
LLRVIVVGGSSRSGQESSRYYDTTSVLMSCVVLFFSFCLKAFLKKKEKRRKSVHHLTSACLTRFIILMLSLSFLTNLVPLYFYFMFCFYFNTFCYGHGDCLTVLLSCWLKIDIFFFWFPTNAAMQAIEVLKKKNTRMSYEWNF